LGLFVCLFFGFSSIFVQYTVRDTLDPGTKFLEFNYFEFCCIYLIKI
jgi:hypothetical protein